MAIEKEKFFEIIDKVGRSEGLNGDNLLQKIKDELYEIEKKLPEEDHGEYSKFKNGLWKDHLFSVKTSEEIAEDWKLLHLAAACNNLLTVELLLEKKVSVNARVKDGSKDGGLTALHIASSYGHENIIELLLSDNRVNPSLKSKNMTPREMVGDVPNRDTIIKMLEAAEKSYRTKPKENAKDLNIKIEGGGHYHLLQDSHGTPAKTVKKRSNATVALENGNKRTSLNSTDGSSDSTVDEQYPSVSVKNMVKKFELPQKINATCSNEQTSISLNESSSSDDSGICTESEDGEDIDAKNEESKSHVTEYQSKLEALEKQNQKENQSLKQQIQDLKSKNTTLNSELEKIKTKTNEVLLEKAQKELTELRSYFTGHGARLDTLEKLNEENESLEQKIQELGNKNTKLKDKLDKTESQYSKAEALLEKAQKELEALGNYVTGHESKLEALEKQNQKENESLKQKIKSLENENTPLKSELGKTKINEVSLEKVGKRQFSPKVAYASLAAMLTVGAALSIASGLSALLIVAASVVSALIAGGITYIISKPIAPDTELKEVDIQGLANGVCRT